MVEFDPGSDKESNPLKRMLEQRAAAAKKAAEKAPEKIVEEARSNSPVSVAEIIDQPLKLDDAVAKIAQLENFEEFFKKFIAGNRRKTHEELLQAQYSIMSSIDKEFKPFIYKEKTKPARQNPFAKNSDQTEAQTIEFKMPDLNSEDLIWYKDNIKKALNEYNSNRDDLDKAIGLVDALQAFQAEIDNTYARHEAYKPEEVQKVKARLQAANKAPNTDIVAETSGPRAESGSADDSSLILVKEKLQEELNKSKESEKAAFDIKYDEWIKGGEATKEDKESAEKVIEESWKTIEKNLKDLKEIDSVEIEKLRLQFSIRTNTDLKDSKKLGLLRDIISLKTADAIKEFVENKLGKGYSGLDLSSARINPIQNPQSKSASSVPKEEPPSLISELTKKLAAKKVKSTTDALSIEERIENQKKSANLATGSASKTPLQAIKQRAADKPDPQKIDSPLLSRIIATRAKIADDADDADNRKENKIDKEDDDFERTIAQTAKEKELEEKRIKEIKEEAERKEQNKKQKIADEMMAQRRAGEQEKMRDPKQIQQAGKLFEAIKEGRQLKKTSAPQATPAANNPPPPSNLNFFVNSSLLQKAAKLAQQKTTDPDDDSDFEDEPPVPPKLPNTPPSVTQSNQKIGADPKKDEQVKKPAGKSTQQIADEAKAAQQKQKDAVESRLTGLLAKKASVVNQIQNSTVSDQFKSNFIRELSSKEPKDATSLAKNIKSPDSLATVTSQLDAFEKAIADVEKKIQSMLKDKSVGPNQKDSATTPKDSASTRISTVEQPGASVQPGAPEKKPAPPVQQPVASVQPSAPEEESAPPVQQPVASVEPVAPSDSGKSNTKKNPGYLERMANTAANIFNPVYEAIIKPFYKIMIAPVVNFVSSLWNKATGGKEKSPSAVQTSEPTSSNGSVSPVTSVPDSVPNITLREKSVGPVSSFMKGESAAVLEDTRPSSNNDVSPPSVKK